MEFLYHAVKNLSQNLDELVYGFKFIRKFDKVQITTENKEIIQKLIPYFKKRLNLGNFHDYYEAEKKIGKGAHSNVYQAKSKQTGSQLAVKAFVKAIVFVDKKDKVSHSIFL